MFYYAQIIKENKTIFSWKKKKKKNKYSIDWVVLIYSQEIF